ncbi:MAG: hypothetical protein JNM75_15455 [Rhodospirillales bacterium]|nr:hypothetical protein [Rhodospirillales bacterium]
MRRGTWAIVALALAAAVPQSARGQSSLCVEDLDAGSPMLESDVRLRLPRRPSNGGGDRDGAHPGSLSVERTAGALSLGGRNPTVHGVYAGCGERVEMGDSEGRSRLSYSRSQDWDPWRRLDGDPFAAEHFFDAEVEAADGGPVKVGTALNMYAAETPGSRSRYNGIDDRGTTRSVTGSSVWLSGLDDRIKIKSAFGMDAPGADGTSPLAQQHDVEVAPVRFGRNGEVFASLGYAEADAGFAAGSGTALAADARAWSLGAGVRADSVGVRLDYRRGRDNLAEDERLATRHYDEYSGRVSLEAPFGGVLVPDLITVRGSVRTDREDYDDGLASNRLHNASGGWGVNMLWRDGEATSAGIDVSGHMADTSALENAGLLPSQRLGLSLDTDAGPVRLFGRLYSERQSVATSVDADAAMDYGGALAAALFGQRLEGSVAYGRTATYTYAPALRWGLAAELDAVELVGRDVIAGWGEDVFALGRLESHFAADQTGWQSEYVAKVVAGFRF